MEQAETQPGHTYRIRLKGVLDRLNMDWFGEINVIPHEHGDTDLICQFSDQPALRGFIDQLWNLNYTVLSVELVENQVSEGKKEK